MNEHYKLIYSLYREIRKEIILIFEQICMDRFSDGFHINQTELRMVVSIENIMELSRLFHDAMLCRNYEILQSAYHIIDRSVLTDDSPKDEVCLYFNAHLILTLFESLALFDEFIQKLISLSQYYQSYVQGNLKDFYDFIEMEEMMEDLRF